MTTGLVRFFRFLCSYYTQLDGLYMTYWGTIDNATVDAPLTVLGSADVLGNIVVGDSVLAVNGASGDVACGRRHGGWRRHRILGNVVSAMRPL